MSIQEIPFPGITKEVAINFFDRMTNAEVRKNIGWHPEMQDGLQSGYIFCFTDFFGEANEEDMAQSYEDKTGFVFIINKIIACYLVDLVTDLSSKSNGELQIEDFQELDERVSVAVRQYVKDNFNDAIVAIRSL